MLVKFHGSKCRVENPWLRADVQVLSGLQNRCDHSFDVSEIQRNNKVWSTSVIYKYKKQPQGMMYSMLLLNNAGSRNDPGESFVQVPSSLGTRWATKYRFPFSKFN